MHCSSSEHCNVVLIIPYYSGRVGATLVDAMDTLFIMEEYEEVRRCRDWLSKNFKKEFLKVGDHTFISFINF